MTTLENYLRALSERDGLPCRSLASPWLPSDIQSIKQAVRVGVEESRIEFDVDSDTSDSAQGYRIADEFLAGVKNALPSYSLGNCSGPGYSDLLLSRSADGFVCPRELKAKTGFDARNGHREVLLSSIRKLRRHFSTNKPICHLFGTFLYASANLGSLRRISVVGFLPEFSRTVVARGDASGGIRQGWPIPAYPSTENGEEPKIPALRLSSSALLGKNIFD